ncbi:glycosyltransferase family 4 protein [Chengkuizengella sp. SCS-71B]|uniref:glycosyltransferase family 4 protein n=1 Tax=Chengkuizengella sp. SCS-71B TaxID=3115290 RepID=UPI0032C241ED
MQKILILANYARGLYNFRFELIQRLINDGYKVYISLPESIEDEKVKIISKTGAKLIQTYINRRGINPIEDLKLMYRYKKIIKDVDPDLILTYTIKPNIYGTIAAARFNKPVIMNITGLGHSFYNNKLSIIVKKLYKYACNTTKMIFFQNEHDHSIFVTNNIVEHSKTKLVKGSGVNLNKFTPLEDNNSDEVVRFLFIARIMKEKGIEEYLEAANRLSKKYSNVQFQILGGFEEEKYVNIIKDHQHIQYLGFSNDVREEIKKVDCIVHPTYFEGMSNVLLEGAAMGKPLIASNVPGCKEIIEEGYNGYLCEARSIESLENKLNQFIALNSEEKKVLGENSRKKVKSEFDRNIVIGHYMTTIKNILTETKGRIEHEFV